MNYLTRKKDTFLQKSGNNNYPMKRSKLIEVIGGLTVRERTKLLKSLQGILDADSIELTLIQYLVENLNKKSSNSLEKDSIKEKLFPNQDIPNQNWNYIVSHTHGYINHYLSSKYLKSCKILNYYFLTKEYIRNGWKKNFRNSIKKLQKLLASPQNRDSNHHLYEFWTSKMIISSTREARKLHDEMDTLNHTLDSFYLENKLMIMTEMANRKRVIRHNSSQSIWSHLSQDLEKYQFHNSIGIELYFHLYKMMTEEASEHYQIVKTLLVENENILSIEYKKPIYLYLANQCMAFINHGKSEYAQEYISLVKQMVNQQIILDGGKMPSSRFKNIITASLIAGEDKWVENFVSIFSKFLPESDRQSITLFGLAQINFYRSEYRQALQMLKGFALKDIYYRIGYEKLLLKIYYELSDFEALMTRATTFRRYLSRERKLPVQKKVLIENFVKVLTNIVKYKNYNRQKVVQIISKLESGLSVIDREWLLSKLN